MGGYHTQTLIQTLKNTVVRCFPFLSFLKESNKMPAKSPSPKKKTSPTSLSTPSLLDVNRNRLNEFASILLSRIHTLHHRIVGPEHDPVLLPRHPLIPLRGSLVSVCIRVVASDETGPVPLHYGNDVLVGCRVRWWSRQIFRTPDSRQFCRVGYTQTSIHLPRILNVVTVVPNRGLIVEGKRITNVNAGADVACFAIGMTGHVPVWFVLRVGKIIKGAVFGKVGGCQSWELIAKEVFGIALSFYVARSENCPFIGIVTIR